MLIKNVYDNQYRIMTLKLTSEEVTALQFAIRREIMRIDEFTTKIKDYSWRNKDIEHMKMLKSLHMDFYDHTIKP